MKAKGENIMTVQDSTHIYAQNLERTAANHVALSPLSFIERTALTYPDRLSVIHGDKRYTWQQTYGRCRQLASALAKHGVKKGDTVAVMAANTPELYEAHFGVPMVGAVLNALNIRLDADAIAFILNHGEAKVLFTDREFSKVIKEALGKVDHDVMVIDINDPMEQSGELLSDIDYEAFIAQGDPDFAWQWPTDEWDAIALNYTSGTTGNPKGVVYHHRGAYLNGMGNAITWGIQGQAVYLWTLPMFHCNGWCFPWTMAAIAGTNVCLRRVSAKSIYDAIADHGANHFCGAPIILSFLINAKAAERREFDHQVRVMTAAAPPPASVLAEMQKMGFDVTHVYGLTEVYGPCVVCSWKEEWNDLSIEEQAELKSRQGVRYASQEGLMVANPATMEPVPADGKTIGEVMIRGNVVMKGYLKNPQATEEAFAGGWFRTGDLGVTYPDGYIQLKDRSKDIIISGGENISSIEVEDTLYKHEAVSSCAVVAKPNEKWGETPCAFVELKDGYDHITEDDLVAFCRENLAHYKCPREIIFGELPKTSTGKIQKFVLRQTVKEDV
jgi:fatty-acyl-CoA synthase